MMTPRERVQATLKFQPTDRVPFDLMEGAAWTELRDYFNQKYGLQTTESIQSFLQVDFRWVGLKYVGPKSEPKAPPANSDKPKVFSSQFLGGPLAGAETVRDVEQHKWPDPRWWEPEDFAAARQQWPDYALVFGHSWMPLFWSACEAFGMEETLIKMRTQPAVFEEFIRRQHEYYMDILSRGLQKASGVCDLCWLGDDYASQQQMIFSPQLWRKLIKPYLAEEVALVRKHNLAVLFHSCGNVRAILPDLIDIGVNAHLVFQTTAAEMDVESIARDFGGRLAFYGGIDVQQLLSFGTPEEVAQTVMRNVKAFERCGGYIVANSHHGVSTIQGRNIEAMCEAARGCVIT